MSFDKKSGTNWQSATFMLLLWHSPFSYKTVLLENGNDKPSKHKWQWNNATKVQPVREVCYLIVPGLNNKTQFQRI